MKAVIHFARVGKDEALYVEELLRDDGVRLDTRSVLPPEAANAWSKSVWRQNGIMANGERVVEVRKHHFYNEWFDVIELLDEAGSLLGYYCDVITPLRKVDGEYYLRDLLLDLWVFPDGRTVVLDWDEFEAARDAGLVAPEEAEQAVKTLRRMVEEVQQGIFPSVYIAGS